MKIQTKYRYKQNLIVSFCVALACLLILIACTVFFSYFFSRNLMLKSEKLFQSEAAHITEAIDKKMGLYVLALQGIRGLFAASNSVERNEFATYLQRVDIRKNYPGLVHIEFVQRVTKEEKETFVRDTRASLPQFSNFSIWPESDRDEFWIINYAEPELPQKIFGFDVLSNPQRKEAYVRARDTGLPTMTDTLILKQDSETNNQNSFLITVPVYKNGSPTETAEEKRAALKGFLTAVFRASELFSEIFKSTHAEDSVSIDILFDSDSEVRPAQGAAYINNPTKKEGRLNAASFDQINSINVGGRNWAIHFHAPSDFGITKTEKRIPYYVFISGMIISVLVAWVVFLLLNSRAKAFELAEKMTENLRASEQYNRKLFEQSPVGLALCRMDGTLVDVNAAYAKIIGRTTIEALQLTYWQITPDKYKQQEADLLDSLSQMGHYGPYEKEYIHKNGSLIPVRLNGTLIERDGVSFIWSSVEDISTRRNLEEQLLQSQKMDALGHLAFGVAHDFNNLLTVIGGYSELLLGKLSGDDLNLKKVQQIKIAADQATQLTSQLLAFSRRETAVPEVICLNKILQKLKEMTQRLIGENIEVEFRLAEDLGNVKLDPGQFEQVMINLNVNARDAMPQGGKLKIETKNVRVEQTVLNSAGLGKGDYVCVVVSDTGSGMTKEVQVRIFDPFYTTKDKGKGSGLGLSTVYGIISQYHGKIFVDSHIGKGTTFYIYLPRDYTQPATAVTDQSKQAGLVGGNETLLIVEDHVEVRDFSVGILTDLGYQVSVAGDGEEALKIIEEKGIKTFDLIITDVIMPRMGGKVLANNLKKKIPAIKILFVSGYTDQDIEKDGILQEGVFLLRKPYALPELAIKVREVLDQAVQPKAIS